MLGLASGPSVGCKKASVAASKSGASLASDVPGAAEVGEALGKKDFDGVVAAVLKVQQTLENEDQKAKFYTLLRESREALAEPAKTDPKASEALQSLRQMTMGR